ncbi:MAG: hypothetical protein AAF384_15770, partial [Pseudomonadota bacterium]
MSRFLGRTLVAVLMAIAPVTAFAIWKVLPTAPVGQPVARAEGASFELTDLISGLKIADGPSVGANPFRYGPAPGLVLIDSASHSVSFEGVVVGTVYDRVYQDTGDGNKLVLMARLILDNNVGNPPMGNTFEVNDFLRRFNTGFTDASLEAAWSREGDDDLRLFAAVRTRVKFGEGVETFHPDTIKFQTDINVSEGNPWSGLFYLKSDAPAYKTVPNALSVY